MKIKLLTISLLVFISVGLFAQKGTASYGVAKEKFNIGVKIGLNQSKQNIKYNASDFPFNLKTSLYTSFHVGVFGEFILSDRLELKPEILFSKEGSNIDLGIINFDQTLSYLKMPVLLKVKPFKNNFSIIAGPQFGLLLSDKLDLPVGDADLIKNSFKSFELSATVGLEFDMSNRFIIGSRYNFGLTNSSNDIISTLKNKNLQFYLGFRIF